MTADQIKAWAREAGATRMREPGTWLVLQGELEHFARLVWNSALERAKDACINIGDEQGSIYASGTHDCADAITALIEKEPKP